VWIGLEGLDTIVGIVIRIEAGRLNPSASKKFSYSPKHLRWALESTQLPIYWIPGLCAWGKFLNPKVLPLVYFVHQFQLFLSNVYLRKPTVTILHLSSAWFITKIVMQWFPSSVAIQPVLWMALQSEVLYCAFCTPRE